jgi:uncharacterized protein
MSMLQSCLYVGAVGHKRVSPVQHSLRYRVYDMFLDVDALPELSAELKLFSYNGFNLFSINDRQFGAGDGTPITQHVWKLVRAATTGAKVKRIFMLCYPAILGRVFNPITTYYCYDIEEKLCLTIYEVSNTFGERHSYVIPFDDKTKQSHAKAFYVSPFNKVEGQYVFTLKAPSNTLTLGVALQVDGKAILQAWFNGERRRLNDLALLRSFFSFPLQPLKVLAGIHWEALKLWIKGMRLVPRPPQLAPNFSLSKASMPEQEDQK